jgi:hypothetical protein
MATRQINSSTISTNKTVFKRPNGSNIDPSLKNGISSSVVYLSEGSSVDYIKKRPVYQRKINSFFENTNDYTNTSIFLGLYVPYLARRAGNDVIEPASGDNFYTENLGTVDTAGTNQIIKSENIALDNKFTFFTGRAAKKDVEKIFIKDPMQSKAYRAYTEEEYNFLTEIYEPEFQALWEPDAEPPSVLMRYVAPTANDCGYCAQYAWAWYYDTSYPCGDPVPDGFVFTSGGPDDCGISASGELPFPPSFDDVPQYIKDFGVDFTGIDINSLRYIAGETYDSQRLCDAYDLTAQSGLYEWQPSNGLMRVEVTGIPAGYAYCSEQFYAI